MFKKESVSHDGVDTLIGVNTTFTGNVESEGSVRIDGKLKGDVKAGGDVFIGNNGAVTGNVNALNVTLAGTIEGNITASGVLKIQSSAKLYGDIRISSFIADEGAVFQGKCSMLDDSEAGRSSDKNHRKNYRKSSVIDDASDAAEGAKA